MNYVKTLIAVAEDCAATEAIVPTQRGGKDTVATLQHAMIAEHPYENTQEDVLFEVWWARQTTRAGSKAQARKAFFAKDQPCLRTSPLPKQYGWGLLFDDAGKVALCPMESAEYKQLLKSKRVQVLKAMRASRTR
jgi:hypothetical protein